jgi:hypothetical protein
VRRVNGLSQRRKDREHYGLTPSREAATTVVGVALAAVVAIVVAPGPYGLVTFGIGLTLFAVLFAFRWNVRASKRPYRLAFSAIFAVVAGITFASVLQAVLSWGWLSSFKDDCNDWVVNTETALNPNPPRTAPNPPRTARVPTVATATNTSDVDSMTDGCVATWATRGGASLAIAVFVFSTLWYELNVPWVGRPPLPQAAA